MTVDVNVATTPPDVAAAETRGYASMWVRVRRMIARERTALVLAILVGALLRFVWLEEVPPSLNQDEVVSGYDAYSLALTGRDHHGHPFPFAGLESFGDWASPLLTFLTVPAVGAFGPHAWVVRGVSAAVGVLLIPIVYRIGTQLFGRPSIGLIAAWLIAVSPWHVHRSRFANPAAAVPTIVALLILAVASAFQRRNSKGIVAVSFIAVLAIASYPTMKLYVPLLLAAAALVYRRSIPSLNWESLGYALTIGVLFAGPIYFLSLFDPGGRARLDQVSIFNEPVTTALLVKQYASYFSPVVFFISGNGHPGQTPTPPGLGVEPLAMMPLVVAGLVWLPIAVAQSTSSKTRRSALFLLCAIALYPVPAALTLQQVPHLGRAAQAIPLMALTAAIGAVALADLAIRLRPRNWKPYVVTGAILLGGALTVELANRFYDYFNRYPLRKAVLDYYQYGLPQAVGYARAHEKDYNEIWITNDNQSYIYLLFFSPWPPSDVHRQLNVRRNPPQFNEVDAFGNYRFGVPKDVPANQLTLVHSITDPAGRTAYQISRGVSTNRGRILVVSKPQ